MRDGEKVNLFFHLFVLLVQHPHSHHPSGQSVFVAMYLFLNGFNTPKLHGITNTFTQSAERTVENEQEKQKKNTKKPIDGIK